MDLPALGRNLTVVRGIVGSEVKVALVAKADAYGHGLVPVCRYALRFGADYLAVATVQEGIALRDAGIDAPILVLSPMLPVEADQAAFYGLEITVEGLEMSQELSRAALECGRDVNLHLKVDTGLSRFGCKPEEADDVAEAITELPGVDLIGVSHHFATASDPDSAKRQMRRFRDAIEACERNGITFAIRHEANSTATVTYPESHLDMVRVGMMAYGFGGHADIEPVLSWYSRISSLRAVGPGATLSYGETFAVERDMLIATVGVGYGDGYPRRLDSSAFVLIRGQRAPVVGAVCMDQVLVDVTKIEGAVPGDVVTLIGDGVTAAQLAEAAGTISHEIVTRIMSRVARRYLYD